LSKVAKIFVLHVCVGQLLLWSVNSALIAPSARTNNVVYEAKFVDADYFQGFVSNALYLRLSKR